MSTRRLYWEDSPFVQFVKENEGAGTIDDDQLIPKSKSGLADLLANDNDANQSDDSERLKEEKAKSDNRKILEKIQDFFSVELLLKENFNKSYQEIFDLYEIRRKIILKSSVALAGLLILILLIIPQSLSCLIWTTIIIAAIPIYSRLISIKSKIENIQIIIRFTHLNDSGYENLVYKVFKYLREFELVWRGQRIGSKRPPREIENHVIHKDKTMSDYCFLELRRNLKDNLIRLSNLIGQVNIEDTDEDDRYNLYEIQKDFDAYLNLIEQKRVESRTLLRKFSEGVLEIKKMNKLGTEINHILRAKAKEQRELAISFTEIKNKMKPDDDQFKKFDVTMNYLQTMLNNYKTMKRNLQSSMKSDLKEKGQLKSKIKYLSELEKTIFAENQLLHSKILEDIAIQRKKSINEDGEPNENESSSASGSQSERDYSSKESNSEEEYLKVYEADANEIDEPVPRRTFEEAETESSARLFRPVLTELADTIKTRKIKHKAKHFKKAQDGKYREIQQTAQEKADIANENEKKAQESEDKKEYKIEKMDFGDFKLSMKDLFKELKTKKIEE